METYNEVCITCEAYVAINSVEDLSNIIEKMDNVCRLISIASGTLVSWLFFDTVSSSGEWICTFHRNSITRPFVSLPLIDPRQMTDVKTFVEATYDRYVELTHSHRMIQVVHALVETRANNFLETRGLTLLSLVDYITGVLAEAIHKDTLIPPEIFQRGKDKYGQKIKDAIQEAYPELTNDIRDILLNKSQENWLTFRRKLKQFRDYYHAPFTNDEIGLFIEYRNNLTHRAVFSDGSNSSSREYFEMLYLLDRLILSLLGYNGFFLNCMNWERENFPKKDIQSGSV